MIMMLALGAGSGKAQVMDNADVNAQWFRTTINVKNGGQAPDVVKLLRAFNEAMPTWVVGEVLEQADHPAKGTRQSGTASIWDGKEDHLADYLCPDVWWCVDCNGTVTGSHAAHPALCSRYSLIGCFYCWYGFIL